MDKREISKFLKSYDMLCKEFEKVYNQFVSVAKSGDITRAEDLKKALFEITSKITSLQNILDGIDNLENYNRKEGLSIRNLTERLDELMPSFMKHAQGLMQSEDGNNIYENDGMVDGRKVPKEDAREAAETWGEGYQPLIDFLESCILNDIQTFACCAGHDSQDTSYVLFDGTNKKALDLIEFAITNKICSNIIILKNTDLDQYLVGLHVTMEMRDNFYSIAKQYIEDPTHSKSENKEDTGGSITPQLLNLFKQDKNNRVLINIVYNVVENSYRLRLQDNIIELSEEQLKEQIPQLSEMIEQKNRQSATPSILSRIQNRCLKAKAGLSQIMGIGQNLTQSNPQVAKEDVGRNFDD